MLEELEEVSGRLGHYQRLLDEKYPGMKVMLAKPNVTIEGLKPGYYHLIWDVPAFGAWIEPYQGPNGEWRDLGDGILVVAAESDTWDERVKRDIAEEKRKARVSAENDRLRARMDRAHEFDERWKSANSSQILVSRSIK